MSSVCPDGDGCVFCQAHTLPPSFKKKKPGGGLDRGASLSYFYEMCASGQVRFPQEAYSVPAWPEQGACRQSRLLWLDTHALEFLASLWVS